MTVHSAAWWGDTNFIKTVALEDPSQLVAKHVSGYTALHLAIWNRHKDLVRLLLDSFWWRHKQTENCWTYLQIAAYNNDVEVLRWLREKRLAEVSDVNYVISWAEENGYTRVIEALSQSNIIKPGDYGIWIIV
jgi:ankyrin repeat protein